MSIELFSDDERALVELYARQVAPAAAIRAKVAQRAGGTVSTSAGRRPAGVFAVAAFAITAMVAGATIGIRGLHGGPRQPATVGKPAPTASPTPAALPTCQLPVQAMVAHQPALFEVPSGRYAADAAVVAPGNPYDGWVMAYDTQLHRWVRSAWRFISPDGRHWLYRVGATSSTGGLWHLAGADGTDRVLTLPGVIGSQRDVAILGWLPRGILYESGGGGNVVAYRWLDPTTGASSAGSIPSGGWTWWGGTTLWQTTHQLITSDHQLDAVVESYDLSTGQRVRWFSVDAYLGPAPSESPSMTSEGPAHTPAEESRIVSLLAVDAQGHPMVHLGARTPGDTVQTLYLDSPGHVIVVDHGVRPGGLDPNSAIGDRHGLWITDYANDVWFYSRATGLRHVGDVPLGSRDDAQIAGPCS